MADGEEEWSRKCLMKEGEKEEEGVSAALHETGCMSQEVRLPAPAREPPPLATCGIVRHHPVECAVPTSLFACLAENTNTNNNTYASTQNRDKIISIQRYQMECVLRPSELVAAELANVALF